MPARRDGDEEGVPDSQHTRSLPPTTSPDWASAADSADDPATPGVVHDTVHVWMRLCESEPPNGQPATATILNCDDGKTVTMARKPGKKSSLKDALKDALLLQVNAEGVATAGMPLSALHEPLLSPLVEFVTKEPPEFGPGKVSRCARHVQRQGGAPKRGTPTRILDPQAQPLALLPRQVSVLMCYGEAGTGRESCLFGAEEAMLQARVE